MRLRVLVLLIALLGGLPARAAGDQDMPVTLAVQYPLLLRVLSFERSIEARGGREVVVAVAFQPQARASVLARDAFVAAAHASSVGRVYGRTVRVVPVPFETAAGLAEGVARTRADAVYLCPLRALGAADVARALRGQAVVTLAGVPAYADVGVHVAIGVRAERPEIVINAEAARGAGAQFSAQLLRLARVVGR